MALHSAAAWPVWPKGCWWQLHTRSLRHASGAPQPCIFQLLACVCIITVSS